MPLNKEIFAVNLIKVFEMGWILNAKTNHLKELFIEVRVQPHQ